MADRIAGEETVKDTSVRIFTEAQDAIDAVQNDNAVAVWEDTYMDQINPNYICFFDQEIAAEFDQLVRQLNDLRTEHGAMEERQRLFDRLKELATIDVISSSLSWIYTNGKWAMSPEDLLADEDSTRGQEKDTEWHEQEREHFKKSSDSDQED